MTIRVLLFASFRELVGESRLDLDVPEGCTADDVFRMLEGRHPGLSALRDFTTFAVNRAVVGAGTTLQAGDELAFLQPVSGG